MLSIGPGLCSYNAKPFCIHVLVLPFCLENSLIHSRYYNECLTNVDGLLKWLANARLKLGEASVALMVSGVTLCSQWGPRFNPWSVQSHMPQLRFAYN